MTRTN